MRVKRWNVRGRKRSIRHPTVVWMVRLLKKWVVYVKLRLMCLFTYIVDVLFPFTKLVTTRRNIKNMYRVMRVARLIIEMSAY